MSEDSDIEVPELKTEWTMVEKSVARFLSGSMIVSIVIMLVGLIWTLVDIILLYFGSGAGGFLEVILAIFGELTIGVQLLLIFGVLFLLVLLGIAFYLFIKRGYKLFLNLLFKIED